MRRKLFFGIGGVLLLALCAWALRPAPVAVDVAVATRGALLVTVDEEGETRVRDRFVVAAPVTGRLERITLDEGDAVEAGSVVARIHPLPLDPRTFAEASARLQAAEQQKLEAEARVAQARAALDQAGKSAQRSRRLSRGGTISPEELELAELDETTHAKELDAALFAASAADRNVAAARAALISPGTTGTIVSTCGGEAQPCVEIRAPVTARVLRVHEQSERVVPVGAPLVSVGDPAALEVVVDVLSTDAVKIRPLAPVQIQDWGGDKPLSAHVRLVEPSGFTKLSALGVEEQRVNVIADFAEAPAGMADGYRVEARIVVWEGRDVVKIPSSALFRSAGKWSVFVVRDGRARRAGIAIGHRSASEVEVLSGLQENDRVVLHPSDLLDDGVRVTVLPESR